MCIQKDLNVKHIGALILAAGKGTRMYSKKPKVLQELLQVPMLSYVHNALQPIVKDRLWTVIGYGAKKIENQFPEQSKAFIYQHKQLGTGHALQTALPKLESHGIRWCLVVNGDAPLINTEALSKFMQQARNAECCVGFMTLKLSEPGNYGRVVRNIDGQVQAITEARDLDNDLSAEDFNEVNSGIYCLDLFAVKPLLKELTCDNQQKEYYITQLVDLAVRKKFKIFAQCCGNDSSYLGVNNAEELVFCEEILRTRIVKEWMSRGVIIRSQDNVRIGPEVVLEPGLEISGPCEIYGKSTISAGGRIYSHCYLRDCVIGEQTVINSFSHLENVQVADNCQVGPFARLRPGTNLEQGSRVGNFVEVKNSSLGKASKANHLTYLGDCSIGNECNIGAGTITCNYDGKAKHKTVLGNSVFIGSNTSLVAPLTIGDQAIVGAGSTITKNVPEKSLSVARERQKNLPRHLKDHKKQ